MHPLCAALAAAHGLGVRAALERQWSREGADLAAEAEMSPVSALARTHTALTSGRVFSPRRQW